MRVWKLLKNPIPTSYPPHLILARLHVNGRQHVARKGSVSGMFTASMIAAAAHAKAKKYAMPLIDSGASLFQYLIATRTSPGVAPTIAAVQLMPDHSSAPYCRRAAEETCVDYISTLLATRNRSESPCRCAGLETSRT